MTYTNDWAVSNNPADHSKFKDQPSFVRKVRTDIAERLNAIFYGFAAGETSTGVRSLLFVGQGTSLPATVATQYQIHQRTVGGVEELFLMDPSGNTSQFTTLGKILAAAIKFANLVLGDIVVGGSVAGTLDRLAAGTSGQVLTTLGTGAAPAWATAQAGGVLGSFKNLAVSRGSVTQVTATIDEIVLEDSSNNKFTARAVNVTAAITSSGANGLDTGAEASNTWYYLWIIRKSSDGTVAALLSASSSSPTMPSGYDQKALISAVRNDGSSNFIDFNQAGLTYIYSAWQTLVSGSVSSWTAVDTTGFVPSALSNYCFGSWFDGGSFGAIANDNTVATGTTSAPNKFREGSADAAWFFNIKTANTLYAGSDNANFIMRIAGFEINKL